MTPTPLYRVGAKVAFWEVVGGHWQRHTAEVLSYDPHRIEQYTVRDDRGITIVGFREFELKPAEGSE